MFHAETFCRIHDPEQKVHDEFFFNSIQNKNKIQKNCYVSSALGRRECGKLPY